MMDQNNENREEKFMFIYKNKIWTNDDKIPLSGSGSSLENTKNISEVLDEFIYEHNIKTVMDLGCGDLTWISRTNFFNDENIEYNGIDIVDFLIDENKAKFPNKHFAVRDIVNFTDMEFKQLVILRDILFHLKINDVVTIFNNLRNKFQFIAVTCCHNLTNNDNFDQWMYAPRNLYIEPFNINQICHRVIPEPDFNRNFSIYSHNDFFSTI